MSKICPNCLHPVRTGVHYCGYCGASLIPTPDDPTPTNRRSSKAIASSVKNHAGKAKRISKSHRTGQSWIRVPITLLVLVILAAMTIRFWPEIVVLLGQAVVLLKLT